MEENGSDLGVVRERVNQLEKRMNLKVDTLKENIVLALANAEKAVAKAETAVDKRLEILNELRGVVEDQSRNFLRTETYEVQHKALADRVAAIEIRQASVDSSREGKIAGVGVIGAVVAGAVVAVSAIGGLIVGVVNLFRGPH